MQTDFQKIQFEAVQAPNGQSMRLDLSLPDYMARVTVGHLGTDKGYCDTEILNTDTEETIHWQHQEFDNAAELNAALPDFSSRLHDLPDIRSSDGGSVQTRPASAPDIRLKTLLWPLLVDAAK